MGREDTGEVVKVGPNVKKYKISYIVAHMAGSSFAQYSKKTANNHTLNLGPEGMKIRNYMVSVSFSV